MNNLRANLPPLFYRFSDSMPLVPNPMTGFWETTDEMWFEVGCKGSFAWLRIPRGFTSDLASVPAFLRILFNPADPKYARAAIIHDYLLAIADFSPLTAAIAFRDALRAADVAPWRVTCMWIAVAAWTCARRRRM